MINEAVGCITDLEKWPYDTISIRTVLPQTVLSDRIDSDAGSAGGFGVAPQIPSRISKSTDSGAL